MSSPEEAEVVPVCLGERSYQVLVATGPEGLGPFAREALAETWAGRSCRKGLIVTDENVAALIKPYADSLRAVGIATTVAVVPPGESSKSLEQASRLYDRLIELRADRHFAIIAIGGGVIGDLAGFVAATFTRGLPLVMVPTTLLAQVDSSVGGKVGVNHPLAKNIVGAFHQPACVYVDVNSVFTLPLRELRCGLAEVVKYGVILDAEFFAFLEQKNDAILARDEATLRRIVARCCELKAAVVSRDEREETGLRAVLNFGHTAGHAIEAVAGYGGGFQHGEAVAVGMVAESRLAELVASNRPETTARLASLLSRFGLPTTAPGLSHDALLDAMSRDKKSRGRGVPFILPTAIGRTEAADITDESAIRRVMAEWEGSE